MQALVATLKCDVIYNSLQIWSTLGWSFTNVPQANLLYQASIKLLISATHFSLPTLLLKHFPFPNNAAFYLFVNIPFSYKYVYQSIWSSVVKLT
jgi:hypothetical protein